MFQEAIPSLTMSGTPEEEIIKLKRCIYNLCEELDYTLSHLDGTNFSAETRKVIADAKAAVSDGEIAQSIQEARSAMNKKILESAGLYSSTETPQGGGTIYYFHDKPNRADSQIIWRCSSDVMSVSSDGGTTWSAAISADGNAIVSHLNSDTITAGLIRASAIAAGSFTMTGGSVNIYSDSETDSVIALNGRSERSVQLNPYYITARGKAIEDGIYFTLLNTLSPIGLDITRLDSGSTGADIKIRNTIDPGIRVQAKVKNGPYTESVINIDGISTGGRLVGGNLASGHATGINSTNSVSVSFGKTFPSVPAVVASYSKEGARVSGDFGSLKIFNKTTTGFEVIIGGSNDTNREIDWIAYI